MDKENELEDTWKLEILEDDDPDVYYGCSNLIKFLFWSRSIEKFGYEFFMKSYFSRYEIIEYIKFLNHVLADYGPDDTSKIFKKYWRAKNEAKKHLAFQFEMGVRVSTFKALTEYQVKQIHERATKQMILKVDLSVFEDMITNSAPHSGKLIWLLKTPTGEPHKRALGRFMGHMKKEEVSFPALQSEVINKWIRDKDGLSIKARFKNGKGDKDNPILKRIDRIFMDL